MALASDAKLRCVASTQGSIPNRCSAFVVEGPILPKGRFTTPTASTADGLTLFVWDGTPGNSADLVQRGAPLYFNWSNDASAIPDPSGTGCQ
ncbi:MAG: hypothetical protein IIC51_09625, partial [Planctomycetes bacterium]|nr:hypothetical protein [Planctomycetota bacterium]